LHAQANQWHLQIGANLLAMRGKIIRRSLQAVVDMQGHDLPWPQTRRRVQKRRRIGAAAIGHGQRQGRGGCAQGLQQGVCGQIHRFLLSLDSPLIAPSFFAHSPSCATGLFFASLFC
jgi:hypothetical protein